MTDWCTKWPDLNYGSCCERHDAAYSMGGTAQDRARADAELFDCVRTRRSLPMAWLMWSGVRVFGSRYWPNTLTPRPLQFAFRDENRFV